MDLHLVWICLRHLVCCRSDALGWSFTRSSLVHKLVKKPTVLLYRLIISLSLVAWSTVYGAERVFIVFNELIVLIFHLKIIFIVILTQGDKSLREAIRWVFQMIPTVTPLNLIRALRPLLPTDIFLGSRWRCSILQLRCCRLMHTFVHNHLLLRCSFVGLEHRQR